MVRHQRSTDFGGLVMTIASLKSGQNATATREVLASKDIRAFIAHHLIRQIQTVPLHVGCGTKCKFAGWVDGETGDFKCLTLSNSSPGPLRKPGLFFESRAR